MLKNRIAYIAVLSSLILLIYLYEDPLTYAALYMIIILPILSLLLTLFLKRKFIVAEQLSEDRIIKGQKVQYSFTVKNDSFLPCTSVKVRFKANSAAVKTDFADKYFSILPFRSQEVLFSIDAVYRANCEVGVEDIVLYDFLGLFSFLQKHEKTLTLTVVPRVSPIESLPLQKADQGMENVKNFLQEEDHSTIADLRSYHPTDGYKKIHWKASAKKNELISKNFQSTKHSACAFIIDNSAIEGEDSLLLEDSMMEALVSALSYCSQRQFLCNLYYIGNEGDLAEGGIKGDFNYLYAHASDKIIFESKTNFDVYMRNFSRMQTDAENLIVFCKSISDDLYGTIRSLNLFGNNVIVFYFGEISKNTELKISSLNEMDVNCLDFDALLVSHIASGA